MSGFAHVPVMPRECIRGLSIKPKGIYVDGTTGGGGHSLLIAQALEGGRLICFDRDTDALTAARERLREHLDKVTFIQSNFIHLRDKLAETGVERVDGILFDLGVSSWQLDQGERGFSYSKDAPLDMRMDRGQALTARDIVNTYSEAELTRILRVYGEERYAASIARAILRRREEEAIETTGRLAAIIESAMPAKARREKQHPAKRSFQAIRIETNAELSAVETGVADGVDCLAPGGRIAVISFHSLEDRIVKTIFADRARGCTCPKEFPVCICGKKPQVRLISRGALIAGAEEQEANPRARSAKLRIAEKI